MKRKLPLVLVLAMCFAFSALLSAPTAVMGFRKTKPLPPTRSLISFVERIPYFSKPEDTESAPHQE